MENTPPSKFSSPLIQKHTPIKRLGLSRKRKSCGSETSLVNKIQAFGNNSPTNSNPADTKQNKINEVEEKLNLKNKNQELSIDISEEEINSLKERIAEKESRLKCLKESRNLENLENLTEVWRVGCKNAYLYLIELLKEKNLEKMDSKTLLQKLGIFKTMNEHFEHDSDISLSDSSQ